MHLKHKNSFSDRTPTSPTAARAALRKRGVPKSLRKGAMPHNFPKPSAWIKKIIGLNPAVRGGYGARGAPARVLCGVRVFGGCVRECTAFHKRTGRIIKLITVQEILDEQHTQKM